LTLTAKTSSQAASLVPKTVPYDWIPAQVTRVSSEPNALAALRAAEVIAALSRTSPATAIALPRPW
jgi:hypothetical protein